MKQGWLGVPVILSLVAIPAVMAFKTVPSPSMSTAPFSYAAPQCEYFVAFRQGVLIPVNRQGERVGTFELYPDGTVIMVTDSGFAPVANDCIQKSGMVEAYRQ